MNKEKKFFADFIGLARNYFPGPLECVPCTPEEGGVFVRLAAEIKTKLQKHLGFDNVTPVDLDLSSVLSRDSRKKVLGALKATLAANWEVETTTPAENSLNVRLTLRCRA